MNRPGWHFVATLAVLGSVIVLNNREHDARITAAHSACDRGNVVRAYLRFRAQHLETTQEDKALARKLFPIQDCDSPGNTLTRTDELAYIHRVVVTAGAVQPSPLSPGKSPQPAGDP